MAGWKLALRSEPAKIRLRPGNGQTSNQTDFMRGLFALTAATLLLSGCKEDITGPVPVTCDAVLTSYQPLTGDTVTTAEGVRYVEVEVGTGETATLGGTVDVNYSLYTLGGELLDTSCGPTVNAFRFLLGGQQALIGFQLGVLGMQEGGVRRVILPIEFGYPAGHPIGNQQLVFDIQLIDQL